ncbi:MAG: hypothetical protein BRC31_01060 [Actinobacteria bacterium QS_5_72_10]|nr:MAG: hypothetical protein BRC31_01060 [Actinobacteria bacterium QS_5_72_10]
MDTLEALTGRERAIAAVRVAAGVFAIVQTLLYEPAGAEVAQGLAAVRPLGLACGATFLVFSAVAEVMVRVVRTSTELQRAGLLVLVVDIVVALGLVATFAFDTDSSMWTVLTVLPLIGAARHQLPGALATWAVATAGYVAIALAGPQPPGLPALTFRGGLLLVIAVFAGVAMHQLERQRRVLARLNSASRRLVGRLEPAEILRRACQVQPVAAAPSGALPTAIAAEEAYGELEAAMPDPRDQIQWVWRGPERQLVVPMRRGEIDHVLAVRPRRFRGPSPVGEQAVRAVAESADVALAASRLLAAEQRATYRLRQIEALRTRFVGAVAHDLRRPLTVISGVASLLAKGPDYVPRQRLDALIGDVQRQANRLNRLADDLLDAARAEEDQLHLQRRPVRVAEVVALAVADVDEAVDVDIDPELTVEADAGRLERLLWNLLWNAEKYGKPPLEVGARRDGAWVWLHVRDHGPGLSGEQRARLAQEFTSGEDPDSVGLGLAIVWRLVHAHGGEVRYGDAEPGARFDIRLPGGDALS